MDNFISVDFRVFLYYSNTMNNISCEFEFDRLFYYSTKRQYGSCLCFGIIASLNNEQAFAQLKYNASFYVKI